MDTRTRLVEQLVVQPGQAAGIAGRDPGWTGGAEFAALAKDELEQRAKDALARGIEELSDAQELLWASDRYAVLLVLQAMDAAGKDGDRARDVRREPAGRPGRSRSSSPPPRSSTTTSCGASRRRCPSAAASASSTGRTTRKWSREVHPEWLEPQRLPPGDRGERFWQERYEDINAFEHHLDRNGTKVVKFFLHVSKEEQKQRFLARLDTPGKEWKFNAADVAERAHWDDYMGAFEDALTATSTPWAPWYVIPADHKRLTQALVGAVLADALLSLDLHWPEVSAADHAANLEARKRLEAETG